MTGTDAVLGGLCAQFEAKQAEAQAIIDNPASKGPALSRATVLLQEVETLQKQIDERHSEVAQADELRATIDTVNEWKNQPVYRMPFAGGEARGGPGVKGLEFGARGGRIDAGRTQAEKLEDTGGFKSLGHLAWSLYKSNNGGGGEPEALAGMKRWGDTQNALRTKELQLKTPSGMYEQSDPDGGVLIPREFSNTIYTRMVAMNQILSYLSPIPISGNTMTVPALKENSRADGLRGGGILGYWDGEANQYTSSKSRFRDVNLRLHKLTVFTFCTDELVNDSPIALQTFLLDKAPKEINFKINDAVINGTGAGMPLGVLNSNSKITVSAVSGQGANTFVYANVLALYARLVAGQRGSMVWMYNQDVEPQLYGMFMATGTAAGVALLTPNQEQAGGFRLMGRPALVFEQCQSLGTAGDVIGFCPEGYVSITKGGIESFMSMHLRFDYDETAFKWRFRFDGQPYDDVALTPYKGSNTVSSIVILNSTRT